MPTTREGRGTTSKCLSPSWRKRLYTCTVNRMLNILVIWCSPWLNLSLGNEWESILDFHLKTTIKPTFVMLSSITCKRWQKNALEINKGATIRISYNVTFVNDMSSGTTYGDGFKNGARSMYISRSSGVKWISWRDIPLLETGFTNSLRLCLRKRVAIKFSCSGQRSTNNRSSVIVKPSYLIGKRSPLES